MGRKVGFSVSKWASQETFFAWTWVTKHLIHVGDELHIVHVREKGDDEQWTLGGPVQPELARALQNYPHQIHQVENNGGVGQTLVDQVYRLQLDMLILGVREQNRIRRTINSVTDYVVNNAACPCMVIRPKAASGDMQRLRSSMTGDASPVQYQRGGRRVALMRTSDEQANQSLFNWCQINNISRTDEVLVVSFKRRGEKSMHHNQHTPCLQEYVHLESTSNFGSYREVVLMGNPKKTLSTLLESEGIDLLVISKTVNSKSLYRRSPCPCCVVPTTSHTSLNLPNRVIRLMRLGSLTNQVSKLELKTPFRGIRRRSRSLSDVQLHQIAQQIQDIRSDRQTLSSQEIVEEEGEENGEEEDDEDEDDDHLYDGIAIEMCDKSCQTELFQISPQGSDEVGTSAAGGQPQDTIEKLQNKLKQKDSLIKDLHERLSMMQEQISFIMDSQNKHQSEDLDHQEVTSSLQ